MPINTSTVSFQSVDAFKVVRNDPVDRRAGTVTGIRSALLAASGKGVTEYKPATINPQRLYTYPAIEGTPVIAFETLAAARAFVAESSSDNGHGYSIYRLHGLARLILPVTTVLQLTSGWADRAKAFWTAYVMGENLSNYATQAAPAGSIAIFGMVSLGDKVA